MKINLNFIREEDSVPACRRYILLMTAAMLLCIIPGAWAQTPVKLSVSMKDAPLASVFKEVEKKSNYLFNYADDDIKNITVTINITDGNIEEVLDKVLAGTGFTYVVEDRNVIILNSSPRTGTVSSRRITGTVRDPEGHPLIGATVSEVGTRNGVTTDRQGHYEITVRTGAVLRFSYLGYENSEQPVGSRTVIDVLMDENRENIEDVVVVGYRTVRKSSVTGSVGLVDMSKKETETITHVSQALYTTPGVYINQGGAQPGRDAATIRIRGMNSTTSTGNSPLILLDGVEFDINEIDPNNIESISILKDVSAAIYGSKASNGVILINSKKGSKGAPRVEYKFHAGVQSISHKPDIVTDPILYMQLRNRAEKNSGALADRYAQADIEEYRAGMAIDPSTYPSSDWFDICFGKGFVQQHNLRLSGGTDAVTYSMGLGFMNQNGVFIANDDARRYSFDLKLTAHVTDKLNISGAVQGNLRQFNEVATGSSDVMKVILRGLPIFSDYHRNNLYGSTWLSTPGRNNIENPRMMVEQGKIYRDYQEFLATLNVDYRLPGDITYFATLGYRKIDHFSKNDIPAKYTVNPKTGESRQFNDSGQSIKDWDAYHMQYSVSHRLVWERTFGLKHDVHAMIGHDFQDKKNRNFTAYNNRFNDNTLKELDANKDYTYAVVTGNSSLDRLVSAYGRLAYTFDDKYFAEGTFRYDGSNRLAKGHRWAFFPSMLLAWRIDRENFLELPNVELLKLRASVGQMGSQAVSLYRSLMTVGALGQNYSFGGNVASAWGVSSLVDSTLGWERTTSYNVGLDVGALKGRLYLEADLFYKRTNDIIRTVVISSQVGGLNGPSSNVGTVDNKGFELSGMWRDKKKDFGYSFNGSVSFVRNKVMSLNGEQQISGRFITEEGYAINSYYLYVADGYFQSQEEIDNATAVYGNKSSLSPGYLKYVNQNNDTQIDENDKVIVGRSMPEFTYGFGTSLSYKNFSFEAQFQGVGKVNVYVSENIAMPFNNGAGVTWEWATDSWTPTNRNAKLPLLTTYTDATENFIASTHWLNNAAYLRLKNVQLTYSFPTEWIKKLKMSQLKVYVSGQNLLTFSPFKLWDPEITTTSTSLYEYPNLKTISFGLQATF